MGRAAEWLTTTWLRFTCALLTVFIVLIVALSNVPAGEKLGLFVLAPLGALFFWYAFLFCLLICRFTGLFGVLFANLLVIYFYTWSGLVVQPPPTVALRLTR
ncbi:MAG: hypothetical protein QOD51_2328 [Candidatus Eremiobacteraeota bacterium]|nr:hypothetical protein [Candidatus Eremiobacteraeota bacterium]